MNKVFFPLGLSEGGQKMPCVLIQTICSRKDGKFQKILRNKSSLSTCELGKQHLDNLLYKKYNKL